MLQLLLLHRHKILLISVLAIAVLVASVVLGEPKTPGEIDWIDVLGEGGSALAVGFWIVMILGSRPAGRVTNLLTLGLGFMFLALWQDSLDEFFHLASSQAWEPVVESLSMPLGIGLLTWGLWHWQQEQQAIRTQLQKREQCFRDHLWLDGLKQLGRVDQLEKSLSQSWYYPDEVRVLVMAELEGFPQFERRYGHEEADRLLRESAELLMLNLRSGDLLCRYARDRLVISLPQTTPAEALHLVAQLRAAIEHFAFREDQSERVLKQNLIVGVAVRQPGDAPGDLIQRANLAVRMAASGSGQSLAS